MNIELIKASAGSGKTHELMNRLSLIIAAGTAPENLLATTFTVKAAAELQGRIRSKLLADGKPELAQRVFDGLIGTVNGICGQLLMEYAIDAGLSPAMDVLPEENSETIFKAAANAVVEKYNDELAEIITRLQLNPAQKKEGAKSPDWQKDVRTIMDMARSNNLSADALKHCAARSSEELGQIFDASVDLSLELIKKTFGPYIDDKVTASDSKKCVEVIKDFCRFPTWNKALKIAKSSLPKTKDAEFCQQVQPLLEMLQSELLHSQQLAADIKSIITGVFACAGEALEEYRKYKELYGLVDFVDQESRVLKLATENQSFIQQLRSRLRRIMVDEFQDTSPIQLALFLKLNECTDDTAVWVGDPKQAIYGFRGADPELMNAVAKRITNTSKLSYSWRSRENLVELSNAIFSRVFSNTMPPDEVCLRIHEERRDQAGGGSIEAWHLAASNIDGRMQALAQGIAQYLLTSEICPCNLAVLLRNNDDCERLSKALKGLNIQASAPSGSLLDTRECQLVIAAYRYCIDHSDTVALATLLALHYGPLKIVKQLTDAKTERLNHLKENQSGIDWLQWIRQDELLQRLPSPSDLTPLELLERIIVVIGSDTSVQAMTASERRMSNINELRRRGQEYMDQAQVSRDAATQAGFIAYLIRTDAEQAAGFGVNTVNVLTYHKSKGLEWPVVILGSLENVKPASIFGVRIQQAEQFDPSMPLRDRSILYCPWPFADMEKYEKLDDKLAANSLQQSANYRVSEENKRLFYVGLTRAKDTVIFALQRKASPKGELKENPGAADKIICRWLDNLTNGESLFTWPMNSGTTDWQIGNKIFKLKTQILAPDQEHVDVKSIEVYKDNLVKDRQVVNYPARLQASTVKNPPCESVVFATLIAQWEVQWQPNKKSSFDALGNAVHHYLNLACRGNSDTAAARILVNWRVNDILATTNLCEFRNRLVDFVDTLAPVNMYCEYPMSWRNEHGQLFQGFIDLLVETASGYVLIDHKITLTDTPKVYAANSAKQLNVYALAVKTFTDKPVLKTLVHFPLLGQIYEVKI